MPLAFYDWKYKLLQSVGSASPAILALGDYVLELFWKDGCEPTHEAMLDYAQTGLCKSYNVNVAEAISPSPRYKPSAPPRSSPSRPL